MAQTGRPEVTTIGKGKPGGYIHAVIHIYSKVYDHRLGQLIFEHKKLPMKFIGSLFLQANWQAITCHFLINIYVF